MFDGVDEGEANVEAWRDEIPLRQMKAIPWLGGRSAQSPRIRNVRTCVDSVRVVPRGVSAQKWESCVFTRRTCNVPGIGEVAGRPGRPVGMEQQPLLPAASGAVVRRRGLRS